jgi:CheY-like chemotaxis protein
LIVKCPQCGGEIRLSNFAPGDRVIKYLCGSCQKIVRIDLEMDEIPSSSSSGSWRKMERQRKVLIADDTRMAREMAADLLRGAGYVVLTATDGESTLRAVRDEHPDLVILDLLMPRKTGFDVLREIKKEDRLKNTPVLVMSGVYKENIVDFLHHLGAVGFIDKENLRESLVFRVNTILQ